MGGGSGELPDSEIDEIVRILDRNGKGNAKASEAVARAMIAQGAWRRMFNQIKKNAQLAGILNQIFLEQDKAKRAGAIDQLYKVNEKNKNNLTGKSGNAIGAMLAAGDPLIRNWDYTELGKKYELIEENGEMVSQQYPTDLGPIDILAQDKKTRQYVVIELKRDQSSDQTVGQLARYMGWLEENKTKGKATKGIILAGKYDKRLYYALKMLKAAEVYLYHVDFKLNEFKEG